MMNTMSAELSDKKTVRDLTDNFHRNGSFHQPEADFELEPRLVRLKNAVRNGFYREFRETKPMDVLSECVRENLSWPRRATRLTRRMCEAQQPIIVPDERIVFTRTTIAVPPIYSPSQWQALTHERTLHESGVISNVCANWEMLLSQGLLGRRKIALATRERLKQSPEAVEFLDSAIETIDAVLDLARRYAAEASRRSLRGLVEVLERVPAFPARSFQEALQAIRICHAVLWLSGHYHCGLGRFDQYMWPYLEKDLACGRLDINIAEQLLAEFFLSLNKDSDLYPGIQQGDNGQSLMLGGVKRDGTNAVNLLTRMVLRVARGVGMIDPKINLRVSRDTPLELLTVAAKLTEIGLGFPQYSNDDVVIPGLVAHGYDLEDARDYSVAACWEFIVPGSGMEVVNVGAVSMPEAVDGAIRAGLSAGDSFDHIVIRVGGNLQSQVEKLAERSARLLLPPAPYHSVLMNGCLERGSDMSNGLKYNNFGIHGACSSNAADALAALKTLVFDGQSVSSQCLLDALNTNFESDEELRRRLFDEAPKVGNNDPRADTMLVKLFELFAGACESVSDNGRGGILRPGSGSAMYYVWLARGHEGMMEPTVGATADGRKLGDLFSSSLAPSPGVRVRGPLSVLKSYAKIDYRRICNGGPLTLELSDTVFRNPEAVRQVALLIRLFAAVGCQQLQINTLNVETLKHAKAHPERHRNLVVRVWGWSGYFCELDENFQDQIISRHVHGK
ncbi:MAG TPA: pyruvate formate lyase family protein [Verrucomicrobiae bacterium]|nr:pyruvate formate lyase family protein [Verrucomicrobiae bacterium]